MRQKLIKKIQDPTGAEKPLKEAKIIIMIKKEKPKSKIKRKNSNSNSNSNRSNNSKNNRIKVSHYPCHPSPSLPKILQMLIVMFKGYLISTITIPLWTIILRSLKSANISNIKYIKTMTLCVTVYTERNYY